MIYFLIVFPGVGRPFYHHEKLVTGITFENDNRIFLVLDLNKIKNFNSNNFNYKNIIIIIYKNITIKYCCCTDKISCYENDNKHLRSFKIKHLRA